jgi:ankyrin repeat protein
MQGKRTESKGNQLESNITYLIAKQEADQVIGVNNAAYHGDLFRLKGLIRAGADPSKPDYDGRTALVRERLQINHRSNYCKYPNYLLKLSGENYLSRFYSNSP